MNDEKPDLIRHADGKDRCRWPGVAPFYVAYHDTEWGVPETDDRALFEKLILDGFQAGLSWITILRKREAFREAFEGFDAEKLVHWGADHIEAQMHNTGIVRNRAKIVGTVASAKAYLKIQEKQGQEKQGFARYLWDFIDGAPLQNSFQRVKDVPTQTPTSEKMSKALKQQGFTFCGPTITYAFMQAVGMVNDHLVGCYRHEECARLHASF
jgi:DNA-3-methyladenine glycosylase I